MTTFWLIMDWLLRYGIVAIVTVYVLIAISAYWPSRRAQMERNSMIPLQDDR
jgi:cbb3-type cytochrome oxidase subunit 3